MTGSRLFQAGGYTVRELTTAMGEEAGRLFQAGGYTQSKSMVRLQEPPIGAPSGFSPEMSSNLAQVRGRTLCPAVPHFCFPSGRCHIDFGNSLIYSELLNLVWISAQKIIGNPHLK